MIIDMHCDTISEIRHRRTLKAKPAVWKKILCT